LTAERQGGTVKTAAQKERAVLVGVARRGASDSWPVEESLAELALLAQTAGVEVVGEFTQALDRPHVAYFIRSGKVEEIKEAKAGLAFDVVIFDDDLSPGQQRNLERELGTRVLDRRALILDIFAQHARTREGAMQVELAQYEYLMPRLTRAWTHLSRQTRGGVGLRGPGETQLEIDRRQMRERVTQLRRELESVRRHRALYRRRRQRAGIPIVAIVGYTNAGKSTLLNALSGAHVVAADQLFATLDPTTRKVRLPDGGEALFTDTVGFVQKLPADLVAAFRATLEEINDADLIVHVVDITHSNVERQVAVVDATLKSLGAGDTPIIVALNKVDLLPEPTAVQASLGEQERVVAVSALAGMGLDKLLRTIADVFGERGEPIRALLPYDQAGLLATVFRSGTVHSQEHLAKGTLVTATVPMALLPQLHPYLLDEVEPDTVEVGDQDTADGQLG